MPFTPAYLKLLATGELHARAREANSRLAACDLCPRYCGIDRRTSARGAVCRTGERAIVASHGPHFGEERPLSGTRGSGTIFFTWCNLRCVYCQNWELSQRDCGREASTDELAAIMIELQRAGCHNINLVSPSHVVAQVLSAIAVAAEQGLVLPVVYNTGGYDSIEALRLLDGIVDIYMPDMKYGNDEQGHRYSHVRDYWTVSRQAVREMHRQVGDLALDESGTARRGLLVRHLVLPDRLADSTTVFAFIAREVSCRTYLNVMDQYRPCYRAGDYPSLRRPLRSVEFESAVGEACRLGLVRLDHRASRWSPSFDT